MLRADAKLSPASEVSTHATDCVGVLALVSHCCASSVKDFVDGGCEVTHARARDDDCVPPAVRFFGDPKKSPAIVFTKLNVETLPFDLELFRLDDAIHFRKRRSLGQSACRMEANSAAYL
jgi:hypothetical protein